MLLHPKDSASGVWEYCLIRTEVKGAWANKILFVGFTLPLLVIYLFLHLQVRPGLLHTTELDLDESTLVISALRPSQ